MHYIPGRGFKADVSFGEARYVHVLKTTPEERARYARDLSVPEKWFYILFNQNLRPAFEHTEHAACLVVNIPRRALGGEKDALPYDFVPAAFILTKDRLISISEQETDFFKQLGTSDTIPGESPLITLATLIDRLSNTYLTTLVAINERIRELELRLRQAQKNDDVQRIMNLNKVIFHMSRMLDAMYYAARRLSMWIEGQPSFVMYLESWNDAVYEIKEMQEVLSRRNQTLASVMKVYTIIIQNNLNNIVKLFSALAIALAVPTALASAYSMNIDLPFEHNPYSYLVIIIVSFAIGIWLARSIIRIRLG